MRFRALQKNWDRMGATDPLWAVSTAPQYKNGRWDPAAFFATGREQVEAILAHAEKLGVLPGSKATALDFGCGVGRLSQSLVEHFTRVIGVDVAPSMIAEARARNTHGDAVEYVLNESTDLAVIPDASVDLVYSEITLHHMEPRYALGYIAEFFRVARPDGLVVFHLPGPTSRQTVRDRIPRALVYAGNWLRTLRTPMMEVYGVPPAEVKALIESADWDVVDVQTWHAQAGRTEFRYWARRQPSAG